MRKIFFLIVLIFLNTIAFSQSKNLLLPYNDGSLWGYINMSGKVVISPKYTFAEDFQNRRFAKVVIDKKCGLVNLKGIEIVPPIYESIYFYCNDIENKGIYANCLITHRINNKYGCSDTTGKIILQNEWFSIVSSSGVYLLKKEFSDSLYTPLFCNSGIYSLSEIKVKEIKKQSCYYFFSASGLEYGVLDSLGKEIVPAEYDRIRLVSEKYFCVTKDGKDGIIDPKGNLKIDPIYDYIYDFNNHLALIRNEGSYGLINDQFKVLLEPKYHKIGVYGSKVKAKIDQTLFVLDMDSIGNVIESNEYENVKTISISGSLRNRSNVGTTNLFSGSVNSNVTNFIADGWFFSDSLKKWGLLNEEGDTLIKPSFNKIYSNKNNQYSIVEVSRQDSFTFANTKIKVASRFGIVNHEDGSIIIKPNYYNISLKDFSDTTCKVIRCFNNYGQLGYVNTAKNFRFVVVSFIEKGSDNIFRVLTNATLSLCSIRKPRGVFLSTTFDFFDSYLGSSTYFPLVSDRIIYKTGTWSYMKKNGARYDFNLQHEGNFQNGRAIAKNSGKWGVIDNKMNIIIPFEYDSIEYLNNSDQNLFKLSIKNSKMGLINKHGVFLTEMEYDEIGKSCNGMIIGKKKTGYGFLNNRGKEITKFDYNKVSEFNDEMAAVKVRDKWGYIGTDGEMLIEPKFKKAEGFSDGMAFVYRKNETGFINKSGDLVFNIKCNKALKYLNGVAWIKESGVFGLIDKTGKWIIKPKYQNVAPYSENLSIVSNRRFGLVNNNGDVVTPMKYSYIGRLTESGMAIFCRNSRYGFMDSKGAIVIEAAYDKVSEFSNGYAIVCRNNIYSVIDISGVPVQNLEKGERSGNEILVDSNSISKENKDKSVKFTINELLDAFKTNRAVLYDNVNNEKYFLKKVKSRTTGYILLNEVENDSINGTLTINNVKVDYKNKFSFTKYNDFYSNFECWDYLASIGEGVAKYRYDVLYGIADYDGKIIFKPKFDNISYYAKGIYKLKYQSQVCYLKKEGIWLWKPNEFRLSLN